MTVSAMKAILHFRLRKTHRALMKYNCIVLSLLSQSCKENISREFASAFVSVAIQSTYKNICH